MHDKKYCDIDVNLPKTAWIGIFFLVSKDNEDGKRLIMLKKLHKTKKSEIAYMKMKKDEFEKYLKKETVYGVTLVNIKLNRLIENKRDCWTKVNEDEMIMPSFRDELYFAINILNVPKLYEILVVGGTYDKKKNWNVGVVSVLTKGKSNKDLDDYMARLGVGVNPRAKQSALYEAVEIIGLNLETGEERKAEIDTTPDGENMA